MLALECSRSHIENLIWDGNAEGNSVVGTKKPKKKFFSIFFLADIFESTTYGTKTIASDVDADGLHDVFGPFDLSFDGT